MIRLDLNCHDATPARCVNAITVTLAGDRLIFRVSGATELVVPALVAASRADELWRTTCFELFVKPDAWGGGYAEFNFSPSTCWAAYRFDAYRAGMRPLELTAPPSIECTQDEAGWEVRLPADALDCGAARIGLSAVIEEAGGHKSYWALAHPPGAPDFHHDACFAHPIAARTAP